MRLSSLRSWLRMGALALSCTVTSVWAQSSQSGYGEGSNTQEQGTTTQATQGVQGPVRLRQPGIQGGLTQSERGDAQSDAGGKSDAEPPAPPDPFERYLRRRMPELFTIDQVDGVGGETKRFNVRIQRLGAELVTGSNRQDGADGMSLVPDDYTLVPGDELLITLWGSVDADLRVMVDRTGRISIPRVGTVPVAGVRYAELHELLVRRVGQVFRNFQLSVSLGRLRAVRVYVTGYVKRPGAYTVQSLSTIVAAVMKAGGPSSAGSFRSIQLRRGTALVTTFDLYDLLVRGDRSADRMLQAGDVVHVGPVGTQVALVGSVNKPAIFELKPGDTLADVIDMAGGFNAVADPSRVAVERLDDRNDKRVTELALPASNKQVPMNGDVLRAFSRVDAVLPVARQNKRVLIDGEVVRPGEYVLPPGSSIADALRAAGGLTPTAFVFGSEFTRESVRVTQQAQYDKAVRDLELEVSKATSTQRAINADEAQAFALRDANISKLVSGLRGIRPTGRIVLQLEPNATALPDLALEDGDHLYIPVRPTTVGVFGSVFNSGSYVYRDSATVDDVLNLAGGPTRGADAKSLFVVRANGSVVSNLQKTSFLGFGGISRTATLPGDTVFVPEQLDKTTWMQTLKETTAIFFQLGVGSAAFKTLGLF